MAGPVLSCLIAINQTYGRLLSIVTKIMRRQNPEGSFQATTRVAALSILSNLMLFQMTCARGAAEVHDEIQVYNAEIAAMGQWTYEQHLNYASIGQTVPEVPGGFHSNRALQGTPEFAYRLTEWWEAGFYLPFAVRGGRKSPILPKSE